LRFEIKSSTISLFGREKFRNMFQHKNIISFGLLLLGILLFTFFSSVISFENNANKTVNQAIDLINTQSELKIKFNSKPEISLYPWLGVKLDDVIISQGKTSIKIDQVNLKIDPLQLMNNKVIINAVGIDGVKTKYQNIRTFLKRAKQLKPPRKMQATDTVDIEIKNTDIDYANSRLENIDARIIGFNIYEDFTLNLKSNLDYNNYRSSIEIKSLVGLNDDYIALRNNHIKLENNLKNGKLWLTIDNNIYINSNEIKIEDINGYINNSQILGKLYYSLNKNNWNGKLNIIPTSLNNIIHSLDKESDIIDLNEAHNFSAKIKIFNNEVNVAAYINDTEIKSDLLLHLGSLKITSDINQISLDQKKLSLLDQIKTTKIIKDISLQSKITDIYLDKIKLTDNNIILNMKKDNLLKIEFSSKDTYKGQIKIVAKRTSKDISTEISGHNIQASTLANDVGILSKKISGNINFDFISSLKDNKFYSLSKKLIGNMSFSIKNGYLYSNLNPSALFVKTLASKKDIKVIRPNSFNNISGACKVSDNVIKCYPIRIKTNNSTIAGEFNFNIDNNNIFGWNLVKQINKKETLPLKLKYYGDLNRIKSYIDLDYDSDKIENILKISENKKTT
jgi:hypothetical protein